MKQNHLLLRLVVLVAAMMCALGASAWDPYACYTSENTTLTFYCDGYRSNRTGTTYDLNTGSYYPAWYNDGTYANVTKVVFDYSFYDFRPTTTFAWFYKMDKLQSIECRYLFTSNVVNMDYMFYNCSSLTSLDLSRFNTSNVTSMRTMFGGCQALDSLDLRRFNTSQVTNMEYMFYNCTNLRTIYVSGRWNSDAVTYSSNMFQNCTRLVGGQGTTYNASHVDKAYAHIDGGTSNPGYFSELKEAYACYTSENTTFTFYYDGYRLSRSGSIFNLNTGSDAPEWFSGTYYRDVTHVVIDPSFADARPTSTHGWFYYMRNLQSITGMSYLNTSEVTNMASMFAYCTQLTSLDLSSFNTSNVTSMRTMFGSCQALDSLDLRRFNTSQVTDMRYMFRDCANLETIYVGDDWSTAAVTNSADMFLSCTNLVGGKGTTYDADHIDAAYAHIDGGTSNPGYFTEWKEAYACYTPSNTTLTFYYDNQRNSRTGTTYDLNTGSTHSAWYTDGTNANVTKVVFDPSFADARPTTTCSWFRNMRNLQSITGMSYLNTSEVTYMAYTFFNCSGLTSIDLSHFNTSRVTSMRTMFGSCQALESLDLSHFNTSQVTNMEYMFSSCTNLRTIFAGSDWSTAALTYSSNMFEGCTSLVGGQGTTYSSSHVDKSYAHIDGGPSNPGYFTEWKEAYACYTPSNTTLTFYYDSQRGNRTGTTYDLNTGSRSPGWYSDGTYTNVTKVVFNSSFVDYYPTTTYDWFYSMTNLQSIEGMSSYLNTDMVTNMSWMFGFCKKLPSLDVSSFNTANVTNMSCVFYGCESITSLNLGSFNTSKVTTMANLFRNCNNLRTIYAGNGWSTAAVAQSGYMFNNCTSLVGGQGTTYDANHVDKAYAHIDGGPSNPGYFTAKNAVLRGDVDGNGQVNITDAIKLINFLISGDGTGINMTAANCNMDSEVNITDAIKLINYVSTGQW